MRLVRWFFELTASRLVSLRLAVWLSGAPQSDMTFAMNLAEVAAASGGPSGCLSVRRVASLANQPVGGGQANARQEQLPGAMLPPAPLPSCTPSVAEARPVSLAHGRGCGGAASVVDVHVDWTHLLGEGSFGKVFRGTLSNGTLCAVKCVKDAGDADMLLAESKLGKSVAHPNILGVHDVFAVHGWQCVALELCELGDLSGSIERQKSSGVSFNIVEVLSQVKQLLGAVAHLHACGYVHRDIKPANVLLRGDSSDGYVLKLADFGIAANCNGGWIHEYAGTLAYMSPEQLESWCHMCCEVWAVGAVMYELLQLDDLIPGHIFGEEEDVLEYVRGCRVARCVACLVHPRS